MGDKVLTVEDVAARLGITGQRVRDLITAGRLPATRFGRLYMIHEADLKLVQNRKVGRPKGKIRKAA